MSNEGKSSKEAATLSGDVLCEVNEQVESSQARIERHKNSKKANRPVWLGAMLLGLIATYILTLPDAGPPLSADEQRYSMLDEMSSLVFDLNDYREKTGAYPERLTLIGMPSIPGWRYQRLNENQYRISFREGGQALDYESDDSASIFFAEARGAE